MMLRKAIIIVVSVVVAVLSIIVGVYYFNIEFRFGQAPVELKPPTISFLIMNGEPDELIHQRILNNPSLLNEKCPDELLDLKTPIITAIAYKRYELLEFMIKKGAPVRESREILKEIGNDKYLSVLNSREGEIGVTH